MSKHCLVTGGCGFVGRHLVHKLLEQGRSVWIIDDLFTGKHPDTWLRGFTLQLRNGHLCYSSEGAEVHFFQKDAIEFFQKELATPGRSMLPELSDVFHLASIVGGRLMIDGDPMLVATDLAIDSLFFLWATKNQHRIGRTLYASSSAAYPITIQNTDRAAAVALREDMISFHGQLGQPDMTYGWSKLSGEYLARLAAERYGLKVGCIRPFSGYGEDQDVSYPTSAIAGRAARREDPLTVWGSGEQGRDFVHIEDCIDAMFVVLDKAHNGHGVNIGTGKLTTFKELACLFAELEGYHPVIQPLVDKPVGVRNRFCDPSLIFSLGWRPKISLREGMARVLRAAHQSL